MKKIKKIEVPAKNAVKKLRVAAYCRVSTKYESQRSSIELQKAHYEKFIQEQPNWLFAGVYVDYGSRFRITKRTEFQKMIQRALNGEIDCIITKSISRFSGNTVDMLQVIRALKEKGVTVWFEKENIRSTDKNIELVITIHTMLAQERKNLTVNVDGKMIKMNRKYNPQNVLGNILECEECGATYRRRTERGKVVYRCATRIEKGREACKQSLTVGEEWIKEELRHRICGGEYDDEVIRKKIR